jgi:ATP-dependent protease ClpP protease subunit
MSAVARQRLFFFAAIAMLALAAFMLERGERALDRDARGLSMREEGETLVLRWSGEVEAPMARLIARAIEESAARRIVLELHSSGGAIAEGKFVIAALDEIAMAHDLETRVAGGDVCLSMCVPIFLRGERRIAGRGARFMFHEPQSYDAITDERIDTPDFERRRASDHFVERYLENSPVDADWLARTRPLWREGEVWKTGAELVAENSNIVTAIE